MPAADRYLSHYYERRCAVGFRSAQGKISLPARWACICGAMLMPLFAAILRRAADAAEIRRMPNRLDGIDPRMAPALR